LLAVAAAAADDRATEPAHRGQGQGAARWHHDVIACMLMSPAHSIISELLLLLLHAWEHWRSSVPDHLPRYY